MYLCPNLFKISRKLGKEVLIESLSLIFHFPPKVKVVMQERKFYSPLKFFISKFLSSTSSLVTMNINIVFKSIDLIPIDFKNFTPKSNLFDSFIHLA